MTTDEYGYPFDSSNGDRRMSAASWRKMLGELFTNGIFTTNDFYTQANNSMQITVNPGNTFIKGAFFPLNEEKVLTIDGSDGTYDRYDAIALEFNSSERKIALKVIKGSSDGKWPSPKRTDSVYQIYVAVVHIRKGTTTLIQDDISDTRSDSWYCGYVTSTGSQEKFERELSALKLKVSEQEKNSQWSEWKTCGRNGCNVELRYRYNEGLKLVELNWDGLVNATIAFNTMGYMWEGFPSDKTPGKNVFIPVQTQSNDLTLRFYPSTNDVTKNHWTLTAMHANVSTAYVCGTFIYSYA